MMFWSHKGYHRSAITLAICSYYHQCAKRPKTGRWAPCTVVLHTMQHRFLHCVQCTCGARWASARYFLTQIIFPNFEVSLELDLWALLELDIDRIKMCNFLTRNLLCEIECYKNVTLLLWNTNALLMKVKVDFCIAYCYDTIIFQYAIITDRAGVQLIDWRLGLRPRAQACS